MNPLGGAPLCIPRLFRLQSLSCLPVRDSFPLDFMGRVALLHSVKTRPLPHETDVASAHRSLGTAIEKAHRVTGSGGGLFFLLFRFVVLEGISAPDARAPEIPVEGQENPVDEERSNSCENDKGCVFENLEENLKNRIGRPGSPGLEGPGVKLLHLLHVRHREKGDNPVDEPDDPEKKKTHALFDGICDKITGAENPEEHKASGASDQPFREIAAVLRPDRVHRDDAALRNLGDGILQAFLAAAEQNENGKNHFIDEREARSRRALREGPEDEHDDARSEEASPRIKNILFREAREECEEHCHKSDDKRVDPEEGVRDGKADPDPSTCKKAEKEEEIPTLFLKVIAQKRIRGEQEREGYVLRRPLRGHKAEKERKSPGHPCIMDDTENHHAHGFLLARLFRFYRCFFFRY